jgi:hypothetical protein
MDSWSGVFSSRRTRRARAVRAVDDEEELVRLVTLVEPPLAGRQVEFLVHRTPLLGCRSGRSRDSVRSGCPLRYGEVRSIRSGGKSASSPSATTWNSTSSWGSPANRCDPSSSKVTPSASTRAAAACPETIT